MADVMTDMKMYWNRIFKYERDCRKVFCSSPRLECIPFCIEPITCLWRLIALWDADEKWS